MMIKKPNEINQTKNHIKVWKKSLNYELNNKIDKELEFIHTLIEEKKYQGIIIYPEAVKWEPMQRPQHLLKKFANNNYLCFFIEHNPNENTILKKITNNLYIVNKGEKLLPLLKEYHVIFYITYFLQYEYAKFFKKRTIWLDIIDKLDFFALYNCYSKKLWKKLIVKADIITYTATQLKIYTKSRKDAILVPNAVNTEDFILKNKDIPLAMKDIVGKKSIIGYFGAIENWFDWEIIKKIDEIGLYNIVLIGSINSNIDVKALNLKNTYMLGRIEHKDLKIYANFFDIAIIPFVVNDLTNSVSPVKLFEYIALNKPIITTNIKEIKNYNSKIIKIINETTKIESVIEELLVLDKIQIRQECTKLLENNTWDNRFQTIEKLLKEQKNERK